VSGKTLSKYIYLFSILFAVGALVFFPRWMVDDAYIVFRYAENLANHFQLTWNVNADPIEGYTGVVLPVLIAVAMKAGIAPEFVTHAIGVVSFIFGGIFLFLFVRKIGVSDLIRSVVILLYSTTPVIYVHVYGGLETLLFTATIIAASYFAFTLLGSGALNVPRLLRFVSLLLFLSLIRPEGVLFALLISFFMILYFFGKSKTDAKKLSAVLLAGFVLPFVIYFAWRWSYYGQPLPNTFYLKTGGFHFSYKSFYSFMELLTKFYGILFIIAFVLILSNVDKIWAKIKSGGFKPLSEEFLYVFLPMILFSFAVIFTYFFSDLLMNYSNRFFIPVLPTLLVILALLLELGYRHFQEFSKLAPITVKTYIILIFILWFVHFKIIKESFDFETEHAFRLKYMLEDIHIPAGKYIHDHYDQNLKLIVHADAGAIPYFSKVKTVIDFGGLNDETLSRKGKLNDTQKVDYFFETDADILVMTSLTENKLERPQTSLNGNTVKMIAEDERFKRYRFVKKFESTFWRYYEFLYVKKDLREKKIRVRR